MPATADRPKILISHSAREGRVKDLRMALEHALTAAKFEVFVDEAVLKPGDPWRAINDEWIWQCDGAVLLLSEEAIRSKYVFYEATLLRQRWKANFRQFPLIPVRLPEVTEAMLDSLMDPVQLNQIQQVVVPPAAGGAGHLPAADTGVVGRVVKRLQEALQEAQPRHKFEELMTVLLENNLESEQTKALGQLLARDLSPFHTNRECARALARALEEVKGELGSVRFRTIKPVVERLVWMSKAHVARNLINILTPFFWVSPEAAVRIPEIAGRRAGPRAAAWGRRWPLSERMYLHRAYCRWLNPYQVIAVDADHAGGHEEPVLEHIRSSLADALNLDPDAEVDEIKEQIRNLEQEGEPVFLLVPAVSIDPALAGSIFGAWPEVTFFLFEEDLTAESFQERGLSGVEFLEPPLTRTVENAARTGWATLMAATGLSQAEIRKGEVFRP